MKQYCEATHVTLRRPTRTVMVGDVAVGSNHPIRIQSMTTSNTRDVETTVEQIMRLADVGCEIARVTVQGMKEADACEGIKNRLLQCGYAIPLVADIHFYPPAAMRVVEFVDKVRINPGNFVDKRASFKQIDYNDRSYSAELERIEERFAPLVERCRTLKRSLRIGTNHGSLSDRIMSRYGDTPRGMVESALEFAQICRKYDYHDLIFSMKASNPLVMVQAYRLLTAEMYRLNWDYPLHLGVTEAGDGEDGRIKSAMGMGALLLDGLGDTIRVSLTEDPWLEIAPCRQLIAFAEKAQGRGIGPFSEDSRSLYGSERQRPLPVPATPLHRDGSVWLKPHREELQVPREELYPALGCSLELGRPKIKRDSADAIVMEEMQEVTATLAALREAGIGLVAPNGGIVAFISGGDEESWSKLLKNPSIAVILLHPSGSRLHVARRFFHWLHTEKIAIPVLLNFSYNCPTDELSIAAAAECGALLCDNLGDGLLLEGHYPTGLLRALSFNILQAARMRTVKTEFISCPSCGRTLFDLQEVTRRIKVRTAHLPGVKIAIMGCIVNGPGEMADADFGYVGSKPGKIDLYVGKECVLRDIPSEEGDDKLVDLIKAHGRWIEPLSEEIVSK